MTENLATAKLGELLEKIPDYHSSGRGTMKRKDLPVGINNKILINKDNNNNNNMYRNSIVYSRCVITLTQHTNTMGVSF